MTADEFCDLHPQLFHMATSQALDKIRSHGLLSTRALLELLEIEQDRRLQLIACRRPTMTRLTHPIHGEFYLRDQKPLRDAALEDCLDGMNVSEWYETLNSRVFLWASRERVERLLAARSYRSQDQLLLTIDSRALTDRYYDRIQVSTINSGATLFKPVRRGTQTFNNLSRHVAGKGSRPIVEVTIPNGVPDISDFISRAEIREAHR